jgi:hypothetical protein
MCRASQNCFKKKVKRISKIVCVPLNFRCDQRRLRRRRKNVVLGRRVVSAATGKTFRHELLLIWDTCFNQTAYYCSLWQDSTTSCPTTPGLMPRPAIFVLDPCSSAFASLSWSCFAFASCPTGLGALPPQLPTGPGVLTVAVGAGAGVGAVEFARSFLAVNRLDICCLICAKSSS